MIAGFICFACSKEDQPDPFPHTEKGETETGDTAYFSVNAVCDQLLTKSSTETNGTEEEFHVENVRIVLYDGTEGMTDDQRKVKYAFDFDIKTHYLSDGTVDKSEPWISGNDTDLYKDQKSISDSRSFTTQAREVNKQDYLMLVVINSTKKGKNNDTHPSIDDVTKAGDTPGTLSDFINTPVIISAANLENKENGGIAANKYFLMTNSRGLVKVPESSLKASADDAYSAPVSVAVDRAVAKVYVNKSPSFTVSPAQAEVDNFTWELDLTNKKTFWMRIADKERGGVNMEKENTGRDNMYAKDPNFFEYNGTSKAAWLAENFNTVYTEDHHTAFANQLNGYQYALENTMDQDEQGKEDVMTRVVLRARYTPPEFNKGDSYFVFTNEKGDDYFITVDNMAYYLTATDYQLPNEYSGLKEAIKIAVDEGHNLDHPDSPFKSGNIRYFYQGYCYYRVPVKHFGGDENPFSYGYYGIVRNNIYTISIKNITGPGGLTVEDGPFLSTGVTIVPWGQLTESRDIGETNYSFITYNYFYEEADGSFTSLAIDHIYQAVGTYFPAITDEVKNAHYENIPVRMGGSQKYQKGYVSAQPNGSVSADHNQNVYNIQYKLIN